MTIENLEIIKKYPIAEVNISDLIDDPDNPNEMSDQLYHALLTSLKTFGELDPIVIRRSNKMIIDGHHRVKVYKECGYNTISAYEIPDDDPNQFFTKEKIKLLRQALNKIHGEHDPKKDLDELYTILSSEDKQSAELLNSMFSINEESMQEMQRLLESPTRDDWKEMLLKQTAGGDGSNLPHTHEIDIIMDDGEYKVFNEAIDLYTNEIKNTKFKNVSRALISLLGDWLVDANNKKFASNNSDSNNNNNNDDDDNNNV